MVNSAKFKVWLTLSVLQCLGKKCKTSDSIVMVTNIHSTTNYVPTKIKKKQKSSYQYSSVSFYDKFITVLNIHENFETN